MTSPFPLETHSLTKVYGHTRALDNVSFQLKPGEIFGLLGPNGAGKTTLISILTTLVKPTSGSATIFGFDVKRGLSRCKVMLGCVPQEIVSHGFFSVEEVLRFHSGYYGIKDNRSKIDFLLERLGLSEHRNKRVRQLSGGMKRRLLIAKALVHNPKLLLLDEPTAGVDIELRTSLWAFVRELNAQGVSILLTTHYLEEAEMLCQRVGVIHHGKLLRVDSTKTLIRELTQREIVLHFSGRTPACSHPTLIDRGETSLTFRLGSDHSVGKLLSELKFPQNEISDINIREGKLEDAFKTLVGVSA